MRHRSSSRRGRRALLLTCGLAVAAPLVAQEQGATPSAAETPSVAESIGREVQGIFERCRRAIVRIEAADLHGRLSGSGFFVDPSGTIYTSYSVGGESHDIVVCHGDMKYPARRVVADPRSGIAILKVDAETPFLVLGKSRELGLASPVLAIGYPMDLPLTPSFGTVGGFDIRYQQSYFATRHIRASVPVQRGEGGAPLLNMRGEAVGILIASLDGGSGSFALPIEAAEKVRKDFLRFGEVRPGWLGIEIEPAAAPVAGSTARVNDLMDNSPGQKAGLRKGDVLLRVGADLVQSPEDVRNAAFFLTADDELTVQISRDGEPLELKLHPADHPGSPRTARGGDAHIPSPEFAPLLPGGALPLGSER